MEAGLCYEASKAPLASGMQRYIFVFAGHNHSDFRLAELDAVADMFGIPIEYDRSFFSRNVRP